MNPVMFAVWSSDPPHIVRIYDTQWQAERHLRVMDSSLRTVCRVVRLRVEEVDK